MDRHGDAGDRGRRDGLGERSTGHGSGFDWHDWRLRLCGLARPGQLVYCRQVSLGGTSSFCPSRLELAGDGDFGAGSITERDFFKDPGLGRSLMGDGIPTILAGLVGAAPTTTYGENLGVLALTRVYSTQVIAEAAVFAILMSFIGKLGGLLQAMPSPVIGGISILLFGVIAASGFRTIVDAKVDFSDRRNLVLSSVVLAVGVGNLALPIGRFPISSLAMATGIGLILNGAFLIYDKFFTHETGELDTPQEAAL